MARQREFDIDDAIDKAMHVFWRRGYVATSMSDIYAVTGLKPGSIYAAFGDKETLFRKGFERYTRHFRSTLPTGLVGLAAIESWLELQTQLAINDKERAGCLIINTVMEREAHSAATQALAQGRLSEIREFFALNLRCAVDREELPAHFAISPSADALLGAVVSIMGLGRAGADGSLIRNIAHHAYSSIAT